MEIFNNTQFKGNYNGSERVFTITRIFYSWNKIGQFGPVEYDLLQSGENEPKRVTREKLTDWIEQKILVRIWN
ncbi:hypothetical protein D3C72_932230 [compost metagenome]